MSCPFCGDAFEDVTQHISECPTVNKTSSTGQAEKKPEKVIPEEKPVEKENIHRPSQTVGVSTPINQQKGTQEPKEKTPEKSPRPLPQKSPRPLPQNSPRSLPPVASPRNSPSDVLIISPGRRTNPESKKVFDWKKPGLERGQSKVLAGGARTRGSTEQEIEGDTNDSETLNNEEDQEDKETPIQFAVGIVLYDYEKTTDVEISVLEGQSVFILETSDPDWTYIGFDGKEGFIPSNYLQVCDPDDLTPRSSSNEENEEIKPTQTGSNQENKRSNSEEQENKNESEEGERKSQTSQTVQLREEVAASISPSNKLQRPPTEKGEKGRKSAFGSFSSFGSTLRMKKKKKSSQEFTIARADTVTVGPSSLSKQSTSSLQTSSSNESFEDQPQQSESPAPSIDQRTKIAQEILSTEANYVNIIDAMINVSFHISFVHIISRVGFFKNALKT